MIYNCRMAFNVSVGIKIKLDAETFTLEKISNGRSSGSKYLLTTPDAF